MASHDQIAARIQVTIGHVLLTCQHEGVGTLNEYRMANTILTVTQLPMSSDLMPNGLQIQIRFGIHGSHTGKITDGG